MVSLAAWRPVPGACCLATGVDAVFATRARGHHGARRVSVHGHRRAKSFCHHRQKINGTAGINVGGGFRFTAIAVPSLFATIVKRLIGRARPYVGGSLDPLLFSPFAWVPAYAGMPSGHATTPFAGIARFR